MYIDIKDQNGDMVALPVVVEIAGKLFVSVQSLGTNLMAGYYGDSDSYEVNAGLRSAGILAKFGKAWKHVDSDGLTQIITIKMPSAYDQFLSSVMHFVKSKYPSNRVMWVITKEGKKINGTWMAKTQDFKAFLNALINLDSPTEAGSGSGVFAHAVDILFYMFWNHLPGDYRTEAEHMHFAFCYYGKHCKESEKLAMHWSGHQPPPVKQALKNAELNNGTPTASLSEGSV